MCFRVASGSARCYLSLQNGSKHILYVTEQISAWILTMSLFSEVKLPFLSVQTGLFKSFPLKFSITYF